MDSACWYLKKKTQNAAVQRRLDESLRNQYQNAHKDWLNQYESAVYINYMYINSHTYMYRISMTLTDLRVSFSQTHAIYYRFLRYFMQKTLYTYESIKEYTIYTFSVILNNRVTKCHPFQSK